MATNLSLQGLVRDLQGLKLRQYLGEQRIVDEDLFGCRHDICLCRRNRREEGKGEERKGNLSRPGRRTCTLEKRGGRGVGGSDLLFREHNTLITHGALPPAEGAPISGKIAALCRIAVGAAKDWRLQIHFLRLSTRDSRTVLRGLVCRRYLSCRPTDVCFSDR